jgi:glycosyltransferase involved in cell wall biosynthesis
MRIALVVHTFFPNWRAGTEVYARSLARKAVECGHEVFVICYEPPQADDTFDGIRAADTICEGLPVHRISFCKRYRFFHLKEYFNQEIEDHLYNYFGKLVPDVVHVVHAMHLSTASIWAAKRLHLPVISTATDFWYVCPTFQLVKWDESLCRGPHPLTCLACVTAGPSGSWIRRAAANRWIAQALSPVLVSLGRLVFSQSNWLADLVWLSQRPEWMKKTLAQVEVLLAPTANTARLLTINGIQSPEMRTSGFGLETHAPPVPPGESEDGILRVGYIGTFRHTKGLHVLLKAMRSLPSERVRLEVYGSPGHFPEYDDVVKKLAEDLDNVSFKGSFPNEQLPDVFSGLDVLVMPALWYENSPLVVLSSFSFKAPVVASNVGSLADLVQHGENGLLFEMGNASDLASQLRRLISEPSLLERLRAGISEVRTIDQNAAELLGIYTRVIRDSGTSQSTAPKIVKHPPSLPRPAMRMGSLIKSANLFLFGAQFGADLSLLRAEVNFTTPQELFLKFRWHALELCPQWIVFIHFLDEDGATRMQGDHGLWKYDQDPWGFVTYTFKIWIAEAHLGKTYRVRLGVWNPEEKIRLPVVRARRLAVEAEECAVSLGSVRMS